MAAADYLRSAKRVVGGSLDLLEPEVGTEASRTEAPATDRRGQLEP